MVSKGNQKGHQQFLSSILEKYILRPAFREDSAKSVQLFCKMLVKSDKNRECLSQMASCQCPRIPKVSRNGIDDFVKKNTALPHTVLDTQRSKGSL